MTYCTCSPCNITFTSLTAFDQHLKLTEDGTVHYKPEECGLVVNSKGKVSLPPPDPKKFWRAVRK